jgi:hypothetical protein
LAKNAVTIFLWWGAFFSAAEKPEKSKILERQQGVPQKNRSGMALFCARRLSYCVSRADFGR